MQLTMLIDLLRQTNQQQPSLLFKMIQNELERIQIIIDNSISMGIKPKKNEFAFIFKEVISIEEVKKIRTTILKIPLYILHFASVPIKTNTVDFNHVIRKPLLKGICGKSALTYKIKSVKYCSANIKNTRDLNQSIFTKEHYY